MENYYNYSENYNKLQSALKKGDEEITDRAKMIIAMEFIARQINDENIFNTWLSLGVADGDIDYGDFNYFRTIDYIDDDTFKDIMSVFLRLMKRAYEHGGLYCGGIVSE